MVVEKTHLRIMPTIYKLPCHETSPFKNLQFIILRFKFYLLTHFRNRGLQLQSMHHNTLTRALIMSSHLRLVLASSIVPVGLTPNLFDVSLIFRMRAKCPRLFPYRIANTLKHKYCCVWLTFLFFNSITQRDFQYKKNCSIHLDYSKSQLRSLLHSPVISSPLTSPARCSSTPQAHVQSSIQTH